MQIKELGHAVLYVSSLERVGDFYRDTLGFREIHREWPVALFSGGRTHHELLLIEVGGESDHPRGRPQTPGLYHLGFKVADSTEELRAVYKELKEKGVRIMGATDHGVTHSIYVLDPDGNELELYADVSDEWKQDPKAILAPAKPLRLE
ncbi:MAG: VOC family protein [Patescibacteria group bacterium]|nr:VOC family protein [Patescibacteria group bacterium]MDE1945502.1 VOC family protein [Patescibacteria group bacterium]MDE2057622.1 VOC family protein [Patescibacteria group bacterium]